MAELLSFEGYLAQVHPLGGVREPDPAIRAMIEEAVAAIDEASIDRDGLTGLIGQNPEWVRVLGLIVGLTQEGLRNALTAGFHRAGWVPLAREKPAEVVAYLDDRFALIDRLQVEATRAWTFADVLVERASSSSRATGAIARGRALEDLVESVARDLGLPHGMRGRFRGRAGHSVPCDLAIPSTGADSRIVVAIKGFDSTVASSRTPSGRSKKPPSGASPLSTSTRWSTGVVGFAARATFGESTRYGATARLTGSTPLQLSPSSRPTSPQPPPRPGSPNGASHHPGVALRSKPTYPADDGTWRIVKPTVFRPSEMISQAVSQFRSVGSDPYQMGRSIGVYEALLIYPTTLIELIKDLEAEQAQAAL